MALPKKVIKHFQEVDPVLFSKANFISIDEIKPRQPRYYFQNLCREIIGQQLAGTVARIIFKRFTELFPEKKASAEAILEISEQKLRNVGMAWSKVEAIKDLAKKTINGDLNFRRISKMSDQEVVDTLTQVKGIGPWTAEMFLMFTLGREDVFSAKDLGLRKAIAKLYHMKGEPKQEKLDNLTRKWSPYRTYACRVLWKSLEVD